MGYSGNFARTKTSAAANWRIGAIAVIWTVLFVGCGNYGGDSSGNRLPGATFNTVPTGLSQSQQVAAFASTVYPVARLYCAGGCHDSGALEPAPFLFANLDPATAYTVITEGGKVSLSNPPQSRVVRRPAIDFHRNCGTNCVAIGAEMLAAVEAWAAIVEASSSSSGEQVAVSGSASAEQRFLDGAILQNGERYEQNVVAFYDFKEGSGDTAYDKSGILPAMELTLDDNVEWMGAWGIVLADGQAMASRTSSLKLYDAIAKPGYGTSQYSVEMWINNENITQEDARIVTYSRGNGNRAFSLEQQAYQYEFRNRSISGDSNASGRKELLTYDVDQDAQETLQHVVLTYDQIYGRRIYVDGEWTEDEDPVEGTRLWNWEDQSQLTIGAETTGGGFWRGQMRMLAIYKQALTQEQIRKNFLAGTGKRLRLTFSLQEWTGNDAAVEFSVTELDDYSYLFCQPTFTGSGINGMRVKNMRIQINPTQTQAPSTQGQAFTTLDEILTGTRHQVSRTCAIVPKQNGPDQDSFALIFEELNVFSDPVDSTVIGYTPSDTVLPLPPDAGFRDFARIDATMQSLTGVDPLQDRAMDPDDTELIYDTFVALRQQLPSSSDLRSVVSSHQVGVTKLAFEYCVELVDRPTLRSAVFGSEFEAGAPSFFESDVATAYGNAAMADLLNERLADHMLGARPITNQPLRNEVIADLDQLRTELTDPAECGPCDAERTRSIAKGLCTAVLASAPVMVH